MADQVDRLSYLEVIDDLPSFVPFRGPDAVRVIHARAHCDTLMKIIKTGEDDET